MNQSVYESRRYTKWFIILTLTIIIVSIAGLFTTTKVIVKSVENVAPVQIELPSKTCYEMSIR